MTKKQITKWLAAAAALCVVCVVVWMWMNRTTAILGPAQVITLPQTESMTVELVEPVGMGESWARTRLAVAVVDAGTNSVYPAGAVLSLDVGTWARPEITLADGTPFEPDWDNPDMTQTGWAYGQRLVVEFDSYLDGYEPGNRFYNLANPSTIRAVEE